MQMGPVYFINWNLARGLRLFLIDLLFQLGLAIPLSKDKERNLCMDFCQQYYSAKNSFISRRLDCMVYVATKVLRALKWKTLQIIQEIWKLLNKTQHRLNSGSIILKGSDSDFTRRVLTWARFDSKARILINYRSIMMA